jgi:hypothetical protein
MSSYSTVRPHRSYTKKKSPYRQLLLVVLLLLVCWFAYLGIKHWQLTQQDAGHAYATAKSVEKADGLQPEQQALLSLTVDNIVALQQAKAYEQLYQQYGSPQLQHTITQAGFTHLCTCLDRGIGPFMGVDHQPLEIKQNAQKLLVTASHTVIRGGVNLIETLHFTNYNGTFLLNGLYWQSTNSALSRCLDDPLSK